MASIGTCTFCGQSGVKLTKEHVYPQHWKLLFPAATGNDVVHRLGRNGYETQPGAPNRFENTVREFCAQCNGGWMRQIDEAAKPFLIPLAHGERSSLSEEESNALQIWATKTALVRSLQDRSAALQSSAARFHDFYRDRTPFGPLVVQAAACELSHLDGNSSLTLPGSTEAVCGVFTFAIEQLFVQVAIFDPEDTEYGPESRRMLAAARDYSEGRIKLVRADSPFEFGEKLTQTHVARARDLHALAGNAPAFQNGTTVVDPRRQPGGAFGNTGRVPRWNVPLMQFPEPEDADGPPPHR